MVSVILLVQQLCELCSVRLSSTAKNVPSSGAELADFSWGSGDTVGSSTLSSEGENLLSFPFCHCFPTKSGAVLGNQYSLLVIYTEFNNWNSVFRH